MEEQYKPALVSIGFKEWSSVCAAIGAGRQRIILRKGGIAEGRTGFSFKYDGFFLFPTLFHEQEASVREQFTDVDVPRAEEAIPIRYFAEVLWKGELEDWVVVRNLEPLHIWKQGVIRERFLYGDEDGAEEGRGSVQMAVIRPWKLGSTWWVPYHRRYGGCRSWVELPEIPGEVIGVPLQQVAAQQVAAVQKVSECDAISGKDPLGKVLGRLGVNISV